MRTLLGFLTLLTFVASAHAEVVCPSTYCWDLTTPGTTQTCAVKYVAATGQCHPAQCAPAPPLTFLGAPTVLGDIAQKVCPGLPGFYTICVAYLTADPDPVPSDGSANPDTLYTQTEGYGKCAYLPAP